METGGLLGLCEEGDWVEAGGLLGLCEEGNWVEVAVLLVLFEEGDWVEAGVLFRFCEEGFWVLFMAFYSLFNSILFTKSLIWLSLYILSYAPYPPLIAMTTK